jgi:diguanylate cyclase (GGDEF)-like protein
MEKQQILSTRTSDDKPLKERFVQIFFSVMIFTIMTMLFTTLFIFYIYGFLHDRFPLSDKTAIQMERNLFWIMVLIILTLVLLIYAFFTSLRFIKAYRWEFTRLEQDLERSSLYDDLTGIHNRRGFLTLAEQQRKIATRKKTHLFLIFCDLEGLKEINDTLGRKAGDEALIQTAEILKKTFRESDIIGRIREDEFIILMVDTEKHGPGLLMERVRKVLNEFNAKVALPSKLSLSIGCAEHAPESSLSLEELVDCANANIYE